MSNPACWQSEDHGCGYDETMVKDTWYTYLGRQNLEGTPAAPGDNGFLSTGKKFRGTLNVDFEPSKHYEVRKSWCINGVWCSQIIILDVKGAGYTDEIPIEGVGIEIDIRCTDDNGKVRYDFCAERATCI